MTQTTTTTVTRYADSPNTTAAYILWFFLGYFGAHRFYCGLKGSGFGQLALCLGTWLLCVSIIGLLVAWATGLALFVWWVYDATQIPRWTKGSMQIVEVTQTSTSTSSTTTN